MLSFSSWIWQKAFDRLEWDFIAIALLRQGIMVISSTSSEPVYPLPHSRSLSMDSHAYFSSATRYSPRLSLITFLLSQLINCPIGFNLRCKIAIGQVSLWDFGSKLPPIHSMLFPDDVILCGNASVAEATTIRHIFQELSAASG